MNRAWENTIPVRAPAYRFQVALSFFQWNLRQSVKVYFHLEMNGFRKPSSTSSRRLDIKQQMYTDHRSCRWMELEGQRTWNKPMTEVGDTNGQHLPLTHQAIFFKFVAFLSLPTVILTPTFGLKNFPFNADILLTMNELKINVSKKQNKKTHVMKSKSHASQNVT